MLSSCVLDVDLSLFLFLFLPFFYFDLDSVCFILSFSCGYYAVSSVSVSAATRLAYDMYIDTDVRTLISTFFCLVLYDLFQLLHYLLFLLRSICFSPGVVFRSRVIGARRATTDCIVVAMS